jgi:hypothetical protein
VSARLLTELDDVVAAELAAIDALPDLLKREEVWTFLRVTERTLDRRIKRGELVRWKHDGRTVIPRASLRAYVLRQAGLSPDDGDAGLSPDDGDDLPEVGRLGSTQTPNRKDLT